MASPKKKWLVWSCQGETNSAPCLAMPMASTSVRTPRRSNSGMFIGSSDSPM